MYSLVDPRSMSIVDEEINAEALDFQGEVARTEITPTPDENFYLWEFFAEHVKQSSCFWFEPIRELNADALRLPITDEPDEFVNRKIIGNTHMHTVERGVF